MPSSSLSFAPAASFGVGAGPQSVAIGDFNGDGRAGLGTASRFESTASVLLSTGTGSLASATR